MRNRDYKPTVSERLEDRALQSSVAGLSHHHSRPSHNPYILSRERYTKFANHSRLAFEDFILDFGPSHPYDDEHLRESLYNVAVLIPFGGVDGLGVKINRIVDRMHDDLIARVPHAIHSAALDVVAAGRDVVIARVRAGDVILR
jgi:hypothetical protein